MEIKIIRLTDNGDTTIGALYIDGEYQCITIEDQKQKGDKVRGETRIPNGKYRIGLRKEGGFHQRYLKKFGEEFHKGMLCIYNSPDWKLVNNGMEFQYILIHIGNTDDDTYGCLLLNYGVDTLKYIGSNSTTAYRDIYPKIANAIDNSEEVSIEFKDIEP